MIKSYLVEHISVPRDFLEQCGDKICCSSLDMHDPKKSRGKVIEWIGRTWVATGGMYHHHRCQYVELRECVLEEKYKGPPNDIEKRGHEFYTGGRFHCKGRVYVMTSLKIKLIPKEEE